MKKIFTLLAALCNIPNISLAQTPKFCPNTKYLKYNYENYGERKAIYYLYSVKHTYSVLTDPSIALNAGQIFQKLSKSAPPNLRCTAYYAAGNQRQYNNVLCENPDNPGLYDPYIGPAIIFDGLGSSSTVECSKESIMCFIIKDKNGNRINSRATKISIPFLHDRYGKSNYEVISDGTSDGVIRFYTKQSAFSISGTDYFLIGYEEENGLICNYNKPPEIKF